MWNRYVFDVTLRGKNQSKKILDFNLQIFSSSGTSEVRWESQRLVQPKGEMNNCASSSLSPSVGPSVTPSYPWLPWHCCLLLTQLLYDKYTPTCLVLFQRMIWSAIYILLLALEADGNLIDSRNVFGWEKQKIKKHHHHSRPAIRTSSSSSSAGGISSSFSPSSSPLRRSENVFGWQQPKASRGSRTSQHVQQQHHAKALQHKRKHDIANYETCTAGRP